MKKKKVSKKKKLLLELLKNIICFIVGLIAIVIYLIRFINKIGIKLFKILPKTIQTIIVYVMILLSAMYVFNPKVETIAKEKVIKKIVVVKETNTNLDEKQEEIIDLKNDNANNIYNKAISKGLTKEQAILVVSISRHETGNWTSKAFNEKHNFGGIMCNHATEIKRYSNYDEGLEDFIRVLKSYYFDLGLNEIAEIGAKYCPVGAKNDPHNLNQYWVGGVTEFYNYYINLV